MGISPDGATLVNTSETTSMAHFIDTASQKVVANVLVGSRPRVARFTADGAEVWVSSEVGGTVSVIDAATRKVTHTIAFDIPGVTPESIQPVGIAMKPDRSIAFVALGPANRVAVVDPKTYTVTKYLLVGQRVWNLAFSGDGKRLFATNGVSNDLSVIDIDALKVTKSVPVGRLPWGVVAAP
jgi:PQQ-dependent catabolism-associated beta-propeller protein